MQRGGRLRRTESQPVPLRGQTYGRRRRRRSVETDTRPSTTSPTITTTNTPLRRSARLILQTQTSNTPQLTTSSSSMLRTRAAEAESSRSQRRQRSRRRRETETEESPELERNPTTEPVPEVPEDTPPTPTSPTSRRRILTPRLPNSNSSTRMGQRSDERAYALQLAIRAPRIIQSGVPIWPPLITILTIRDAETGAEISGEDELSYLFVQAALYDESGSPRPIAIAPPDSGAFSGRFALSPELINDGDDFPEGAAESSSSSAWARSRGSFAMFSDLRINRPGLYRIGFTLLKIGGDRSRSASGGRRRRNEGGMSLAEVRSDVIRVQEDRVVDLPVSPYAQDLLDHLRDRGVDLPSPQN